MRSLKKWTQEEMAEKLKISIRSYAKIERGETNVNLSRLEQIAEVMEIDLSKLLGLDEKNVFNVNNSQCQHFDNWHVISSNQQSYDLEKSQLIIEQQKTEIDYLKQQVIDLRKINDMLTKTEHQEY
ncbi:MAG: helix-turn-helix transcriptional regulator [Thiomargarita sp.]|nr:helix-turn-helix transcriptional regulator [Thiomargarita sp.]